MNKKPVFAITLFVISNLFVFYYLLNNSGLFTNMFKVGFKPEVTTLSYLFSSLVMVGVFLITFLGRSMNKQINS